MVRGLQAALVRVVNFGITIEKNTEKKTSTKGSIYSPVYNSFSSPLRARRGVAYASMAAMPQMTSAKVATALRLEVTSAPELAGMGKSMAGRDGLA